MDERAVAREALDRFTAAYHLHPPPVDVEQLCESLCCLRIRTSDDLGSVPGAPDGVALSGMLLPARKEVWVIAHEVGHYLLHVGEISGGVFCRAADLRPDPESPERLREREANCFAAELLMPEQLVAGAVDRHGPDPVALAPLFAVSDLAMGFRLVNLGHLQALPVDLDRTWQEWRV